MAVDACKNSDNVDFSLVPEFSKYYESVRNHHWMVFRPECKTHLFAYKAYVQGRRESELKMKAREAKLVEALRLLEQVSTAPKNGKISLELYREKAREVLKELGVKGDQVQI